MGRELHPPDRPIPGVVIRPAVERDCARVAPDLREHDRAELRAVILGEDDESRLLGCMRQSDETWAVEVWTRPVALFGITRVVQGDGVRVGIPWCLGTPALIADAKAFVRSSKEWLAWLARDCEISCNVVSARNAVHRRWIRSLGYEFMGEQTFGGLRFLEFVRVEDSYVPRNRGGSCFGVCGGDRVHGDDSGVGSDSLVSDQRWGQHGAAAGEHEGSGEIPSAEV